jgi:hypothetical protein
MPIQHELRRILEQRETLSRPEASALMESILAGHASDIELAALLGALAARGETSAEIAGFASTLRSSSPPPLEPTSPSTVIEPLPPSAARATSSKPSAFLSTSHQPRPPKPFAINTLPSSWPPPITLNSKQ